MSLLFLHRHYIMLNIFLIGIICSIFEYADVFYLDFLCFIGLIFAKKKALSYCYNL